MHELNELFVKIINFSKKNIAIIAQTTYNKIMWNECKEYILKHYPNAIIFDTICNATSVRQTEAIELSKKADVMLIVGGLHSSNTVKLKQVCEDYCKCYHIESAKELYSIDFSGAKIISYNFV